MFPDNGKLNVAVITGYHPFELPQFYDLWKNLPGINAYVQPLSDYAADAAKCYDKYDVIAFYNFHREIQTDHIHGWFTSKTEEIIKNLGESGQGIIMLHHAHHAFMGWDEWNKLFKIEDRTCHKAAPEEMMDIIINKEHPIGKHIDDFTIMDEAYEMNGAEGDIDVVATTTHPISFNPIAWTHKLKNSNVFCTGLGHDHFSWENDEFKKLIELAIKWTACKL